MASLLTPTRGFAVLLPQVAKQQESGLEKAGRPSLKRAVSLGNAERR
jgi:hypothetical protein